jgi:uncharacterized RDD family membrane protein YckC
MSAPATAYTPPIDKPPPQAVTASPYGGFWVRFAAYFVDSIIIGIGGLLVAVVWGLAFGWKAAADSESNDLLALVFIVLSQLYHAYFVSSARMATPGKRLCGLYVTDLEGRRLGFGRALWRNVAALFSYLTLYIGFFMAGFTERKQALHDKLAGTLVHRQPSGGSIVVIAIVLGLFLLIIIGGIVAAIAIPAYQDYTVRAKVAGVISVVAAVKQPIASYAAQHGKWPTTWEQLESFGGSDPRYRMLINPGALTIVKDIRLEEGGAIVSYVEIRGTDGQIRLAPRREGDTVEWTCTASPEIRRYVPGACR